MIAKTGCSKKKECLRKPLILMAAGAIKIAARQDRLLILVMPGSSRRAGCFFWSVSVHYRQGLLIRKVRKE